MKTTQSIIGLRDPRPKVCRFCNARVSYVQKVNSKEGTTYRITKHKHGCRMAKRKGMGGPAPKLVLERLKEKELAVNPLALMKLSPAKFGKRVNQYLESNY